MKYYICLFVFLLSFSASAFEYTVYNYDSRSPSHDIFAFKAKSSTKVPDKSNLPLTEVTDKKYSALVSYNNTYPESKSTEKTNLPSMRSVIFIDQEKYNVTELDILWNGYVDNNNKNKKPKVSVILYLWNFESKNYEKINSVKSSSKINITYSFTHDIADYIGGEKENTIILYAVAQPINGKDKGLTLYTDYVQVNVTVPAIDHYKIVHDGNGLTCEAETLTIKACTNSDCTTESTESVSVDFTITSPATGKVTKFSPIFTGSSRFKFKHVTAERIVLSIDNASIDASNAVQCSGGDTGCDMTFADTGFRFLYGDSEIISAQTAGHEFDKKLKIHAVKSKDGVCDGLFNGDVKISLAQQNITPNLAFNAGLAFQIKGVTIAKYPQFTDEVILNFGSNSIAILPEANYFDAGNIRLHANFSNEVITLVGSSNDFWVKPHYFALIAKNSNGALVGNSAASVIKHKAGENFNFTVSALNFEDNLTQNYRQADGQLQLKVSRTAPVSNGAIDGKFTYAAGKNSTRPTSANFRNAILTSFSDGVKGQAEFSGARYDEVGVINLDVQDTNYGNLGNVEGLVSATDLTVGRFTPAYFKQTVREEHKGDFDAYPYPLESGVCSFSDWAYTGQRSTDNKGAIAYSLPPKITITAFNANDGITKNYTLGKLEGFMRLSATSVDISLPTHDKIQQVVDSTGGDPVAISAVMHTGSLSASLDNNDDVIAGEWLYTFSTNDHFSYHHDGTSLLAPFTAKIPFITEQINDADGIKLAQNHLTNKVAESAIEPFVTEGVQIRFARMVLQNSYGSENAKLRAQLNVEVYDGASFTTHTDEHCLTPLIGNEKPGAKYSGNMNLWDYRLIDIDSDKIQVSDTKASVSGDFHNGMLSRFFFSKPKQQGALEWEYKVPSWLAFNWNTLDANNDGNFYDDNPSATLSFGVYRGNDRIISWYEVLN
jgi:MSHA biogenesis protein MshQ